MTIINHVSCKTQSFPMYVRTYTVVTGHIGACMIHSKYYFTYVPYNYLYSTFTEHDLDKNWWECICMQCTLHNIIMLPNK